MQTSLNKRVLKTSTSCKASLIYRPVRVCKRGAQLRNGNASRRAAVECNAFFNFFTPKPAAPVPLIDPRAKPLVEQLVSLASGTDAGAKASAAQKEEIAAVVTELSRYCMKNPLKSDLLFGEWKVLFSSKPTAVGGPLRSGAGPTVFPGQDPRQILEAPNKLINSVEYKTLGFLPGYSRQYGEIEPISGDTFILNITNGEIMAGLGGPIKKEFNIQRKIKILYLDDEIRVALFLPSTDLPDSEADANGGRSQEDVVFVFQRVKEEAEPEEEVAEDDGEAAAVKPAFFGSGRKLESAATVAERQVRQQLKEQRGGSSRLAIAPPAKPSPAPGSSRALVVAPRPASVRGRKQPVEEVEEDPRERRRREQEEERARKAAEAEARAAEAKAARERAEAERQAEREKQSAIKELLAQLAADVKQRQVEAREAQKELKEVEKSTAASLKEVASARSRLEEAEGDVKAVSAELEAANASKREVEKEAKAAKEVVVTAEKALRAAISAMAPVLSRK